MFESDFGMVKFTFVKTKITFLSFQILIRRKRKKKNLKSIKINFSIFNLEVILCRVIDRKSSQKYALI